MIMKKLLSILVLSLLFSGNAYAEELSFTCQIENSNGELIPQTKTLYEIKKGKIYEGTYEMEGVKNLKINNSIITFNYDPENQRYTNESYYKVNLSTGNFYTIKYIINGGADTTFGKCEKF